MRILHLAEKQYETIKLAVHRYHDYLCEVASINARDFYGDSQYRTEMLQRIDDIIAIEQLLAKKEVPHE